MTYFRTRQAFDHSKDLTPAIGSKGDDGGWCLVKHRVHKNYSAGYKALDEFLVKKKNIDRYSGKSSIEQGAYNIIRFDPTGDEKKYFKTIQIEPHGQMMMDFRGVTLENVQKAVDEFLPLYEEYMINNYVRNSAGKFVLVENPINSGTMIPCSDFEGKRNDGKDCFQIEKFNVRYVFAVEDENPSAKEPYEKFNTLLVITAHATYPHKPKSGFGCDENTGDLKTNYSSPDSSWGGGGGITLAPQQKQKRKASIQRVARLYMISKFDQ